MNVPTTKLAVLLFAALCSAGMLVTSAAAQTAAMLPAQRDVKTSSSEHAEAMAFVYETLVERGVNVVADETEVEKKLIEKGMHSQCQSATSCGPKIASLLGVDFVVSTVVWTDQSVQKRPQSVAVGLITPEGQTHNGAAEVRDGNIKEASRQATLKALQDREAKQLGWLVVQSTPSGAHVELDGTPSGKTPYKRMVPVGKHSLKLTAPGHSSQTRDITVSKKTTATTTFTLEPGDSDDDESSGTKPSEWNYVIGAGLAVVGGLAIASFVRTAINDGDCSGDYGADGVCDEEVSVSPMGYVALGVGIAALAGAGAMFLWAPIRVTPTVDPTTKSAGLILQGRF